MKKLLLISLGFLLSLSSYSQNNPPVAVNDTIEAYIQHPVIIRPLVNDYDPDGDSIYLFSPSGLLKQDDSTWQIPIHYFTAVSPYDTAYKMRYFIKDAKGAPALGYIVIKIKSYSHPEYLDINNMRALISPFGNHFWDLGDSLSEMPKGSGLTSIFNNALWFGAKDTSGAIHGAAEEFRQDGADYFTGPISTIYDSSYFKKWNRAWKIDKAQIRYHIQHWQDPGYQASEVILNWPAHGNLHLGQTALLAPFHDSDNDGFYNPMQGDYPIIRGDQAVYFIFNDLRGIHTESKGMSLGIEIHGMAYEFNRPEDSTLSNSIFFHYDILNKSDTLYLDSYMGLLSGLFIDGGQSYVGTDVTNGMIYVYNYDSICGTPPTGYGLHPPALGMKLIAGPSLPADGADNPKGNCDEGINGLNFEDGTADNERSGLSYSAPKWDSGQIGLYSPLCYISMKGMRAGSNTPCMYGDSLIYSLYFYYISYGGQGPACRYYYPGNSDLICNYGTAGVLPNGGYNQNEYYWTEETVNNPPGFRNMIASTGPFTFPAGESVPLDFCYVFARDYNGDNHSSVELLRERVTEKTDDWAELIKLPESYTSVPVPLKKSALKCYPNPVKSILTVQLETLKPKPFEVITINGKPVLQGNLLNGKNNIDTSALSPGVYILKAGHHFARFVKL
ncbi:MAG: T9SS type A sorting domain-containing protein [Bacteroidales bacterium]|nr:T9SS type A sorting domain-containing protein [Bacteroidales bacterium]